MTDQDMVDDLPVSSTEEVLEAVPGLRESVLLLDFDGCLSWLVDDPHDAVPADGAVEALERIATTTRLVLVSGRPVSFLRTVVPGELGVAYAGGHGAEYARGTDEVAPLVDVDTVRGHRDRAVEDLEDLLADAPGWYVEVKPTGVAVHSRRAEDPDAYMEEVREVLGRHTGDDDMVVLPSHEVLELRPSGVDKGTAAEHLLGDDERIPVSLGDDVTDEDMFAVAVARGGMAVMVGTEPRRTHARHRVPDPDAVVAVLQAWADRDA
jgi:trehalose-phosphatase